MPDDILDSGSYCNIVRVKEGVLRKELKSIFQNDKKLKKRMQYEFENMQKLKGCPQVRLFSQNKEPGCVYTFFENTGFRFLIGALVELRAAFFAPLTGTIVQ